MPGATKESPGALQARFAKVVIPNKTENDMVGQMIRKPPPSNMPSIDLIVNELVVRESTAPPRVPVRTPRANRR